MTNSCELNMSKQLDLRPTFLLSDVVIHVFTGLAVLTCSLFDAIKLFFLGGGGKGESDTNG